MDKKSFRQMVKELCINQATGIIWGFVISMVFLSFLDEYWGLLCTSVFSVGIMMSSVYTTCFHRGFRDRNTCHMHDIKPDRLRGLWAGLWASVPSVVVIIAYLTATYLIRPAFVVVNVIARVWFMPYTFLFNHFVESYSYFAFPVILLMLPIFSCWGYYMGLRDIRILEHVIYKKQPNSKKKR